MIKSKSKNTKNLLSMLFTDTDQIAKALTKLEAREARIDSKIEDLIKAKSVSEYVESANAEAAKAEQYAKELKAKAKQSLDEAKAKADAINAQLNEDSTAVSKASAAIAIREEELADLEAKAAKQSQEASTAAKQLAKEKSAMVATREAYEAKIADLKTRFAGLA